MVEDLGLAALSRGDQVLVEDLEDIFADLGELGLDLHTVLFDESDLALVTLGLFLLLNRGNDSPGCATCADDVLVGDGKKISLLNGEFLVGGSDGLHVLHHFCKSLVNTRSNGLPTRLALITLSLLSELSEIDGIFVTHLDGDLQFY